MSELRPRLVAHGGIDQVFVVSAVAGDEHSAAIDSLGQVSMSLTLSLRNNAKLPIRRYFCYGAPMNKMV